MGDRIGRKTTLIVTFTLMGITTALIGVLPTYEQVGYLAPVLLVVLRVLQGMGAGAEYAGAAVVSYEHAKSNKRGSQGAWPALGLNLGLVLPSLTIFLLSLNGDEFLVNSGWRIPFIASIVLVAIGLWVRRSMPESPEFEKARKNASKVTIRTVVANDWRGLLVVLIVAISYIFTTFSIAYLAEFQGKSAAVTSLSMLIAGVIAVIAVPIFGHLCDRFSSKTMIMLGGVLASVFAFPFLWLLQTEHSWGFYVAIAIGTGLLAPMMFSAQGRHFSSDHS